MSEKSQATHWREKGNEVYTSAFDQNIPTCVQRDRLKEALRFYEKSKHYSAKNDDKCSISKNIGVASKKLACMMGEADEAVGLRHYFFKQAIANFDEAFRFGKCKSGEWLDKVAASFQDCIQEAIYDVRLLTLEKQTNQLLDYVMCISNATNQRGELLIEIAQMRFRHALACIQNNDYKQCLHQLAECHWPVEEAKRLAEHKNSYIAMETRVLEKDLFIHRCIAESAQARVTGDEILEKLLKDEETLNMEMVWRVVDLYTEAILLTRENDMELEAIALSRLGNVNDKILKDKPKARICFHRAIQLAHSLHPRTFYYDDWFRLCKDTLERYQQEVLQQESDKWNKERAVHLKELAKELELIKELDTPDTLGELLQHVYKAHPPKKKNWKLGEIPEKGSEDYRKELKDLLRCAIIHYHPDRAKEEDGKKWKVLCEEITKTISNRYENFKAF